MARTSSDYKMTTADQDEPHAGTGQITYLQCASFSNTSFATFEILNRTLRRAPQPPETLFFTLFTSPPMPQRQSPHQHAHTATATLRRAELKAVRRLGEAVCEVMRDT